jgi:predicted esterase
VQTNTVEIYASAAAQINVAAMDRVGRLFYTEYTGSRLQSLQPNARLLVPTPAGGTYRLAADEGVFAYTPRAAGVLFFAVVDTGSAVVNAGNSDSTAFQYDPVNNPVRPHPQFSTTTPGGYTSNAYVVWAEGRDDHTNARPDIPVLGDADKNGVPHVFAITLPLAGPPAEPASCVFAMHGGGGEYQLFRPGMPSHAPLTLPLRDGIVVSPDDSYYAGVGTNLTRNNTSWFGYTTQTDPFSAVVPRTSPPAGSVVVNFTQRRVHWILDWLTGPLSPHRVNPERVAMLGHSGGARGTSHLTRLRPERFAAAVLYTPASDLPLEGSGQENFLRGDWANPLDTNLVDAGGQPINVTEAFTMTTRLSTTQRDFPMTRIYYGKRDEDGPASWTVAQRAIFDSLHDANLGYMLFWDEREHGVDKWDEEANDMSDGHAGPWPDVGQWVAAVRTQRPSAQALVDDHRASRSYPGFTNTDEDPVQVGRQPDPGPGDPDLGDAWGTWGGHMDWDGAGLIDTASRWECRVFVSGLAPSSVDNASVRAITADLSPQKTRFFNLVEDESVYWYAIRSDSNVVDQQGIVLAGPLGVVNVPGLVVPREDLATLRVLISRTPACVGDSTISPPTDVISIPGGTPRSASWARGRSRSSTAGSARPPRAAASGPTSPMGLRPASGRCPGHSPRTSRSPAWHRPPRGDSVARSPTAAARSFPRPPSWPSAPPTLTVMGSWTSLTTTTSSRRLSRATRVPTLTATGSWTSSTTTRSCSRSSPAAEDSIPQACNDPRDDQRPGGLFVRPSERATSFLRASSSVRCGS